MTRKSQFAIEVESESEGVSEVRGGGKVQHIELDDSSVGDASSQQMATLSTGKIGLISLASPSAGGNTSMASLSMASLSQ